MFNEMMRAEIWLQETLAGDRAIETLSGRVGYSPSQVRRRFHECFGMSPRAYRDKLRLEKAAMLLAHTPEGIRGIAERCGYHNHSAFSRAFQRQFRCTPRQFRQGRRAPSAPRSATAERYGLALRRTRQRSVVVTRVYRASRALRDPAEWHEAEGAGVLTRRLGNGHHIALLHDQPMRSDLPRTDLGATLASAQAEELSLPPAFRHLWLPARRCACVSLPAIERLGEAMAYLVDEALPERGEYLNGEPVRLLRKGTRLELQLPLHEPS